MGEMTEDEFDKELVALRKQMWQDIELTIDNTERKVARLKEMYGYGAD